MSLQIRRWINERRPLDAVLRWPLEEEIPGRTNYANQFDSSIFLTFLLQVVTGIFQLIYFVPAVAQGSIYRWTSPATFEERLVTRSSCERRTWKFSWVLKPVKEMGEPTPFIHATATGRR